MHQSKSEFGRIQTMMEIKNFQSHADTLEQEESLEAKWIKWRTEDSGSHVDMLRYEEVQ